MTTKSYFIVQWYNWKSRAGVVKITYKVEVLTYVRFLANHVAQIGGSSQNLNVSNFEKSNPGLIWSVVLE